MLELAESKSVLIKGKMFMLTDSKGKHFVRGFESNFGFSRSDLIFCY